MSSAGDPDGTGSCLHCALLRALKVESRAFGTTSLNVVGSSGDRQWVPIPGGVLYRQLRRLFKDARRLAVPGSPLRVRVYDQTGKTHVEVIVSFVTRNGEETLSYLCERALVSRLWGGFAETA
jgi:hypothetical protein